MQKIRNNIVAFLELLVVSSLTLLLSACSVNGYKSKWDCGVVKGMGCHSMAVVDEVARKQIILNTETGAESRMVLIEEHYDDFKLVPRGYERMN